MNKVGEDDGGYGPVRLFVVTGTQGLKVADFLERGGHGFKSLTLGVYSGTGMTVVGCRKKELQSLSGLMVHWAITAGSTGDAIAWQALARTVAFS